MRLVIRGTTTDWEDSDVLEIIEAETKEECKRIAEKMGYSDDEEDIDYHYYTK